MYTQCPECLTVYALDTATLAQAQGHVGCGQCGATFNALTSLVEALPDDGFEILSVHPSSPAPPILMMAVVHDRPPQHPLFEDATADADDADAATPVELADSAPEPLPSFVVQRRRAPDTPRHRLAWALGCLVLVLTLGMQMAWAERVPLTANPATRPWLAKACDWFGCTVPPVRDLADLQLLSRDVRPHPSVPGALLISATIRNNAAFTQPYPVVSITLSDLDENRIAMRRFRPSVYIRNASVRAAGLAPGATAALMFEVADPGRHAVAFEFDFQ
ncbi:MAG TPA: zinc-ribbon and DUF3426 domain-containing protein [Oleiagrimonas sp.]|nr:zinc-ribbon and DUF3426 domain-containing protein [Oleiagrimonas sp.]